MRCASSAPPRGEIGSGEIVDGQHPRRQPQSRYPRSTNNNNVVVDEEFRPRRRFKVSGTMFEVDAKYELIKPIGHGAYGVVISALNVETSQKVAIKKITRAFEDLVDAKRILREIKLLRKFSHDNIISILDILVPPSSEEFEDVYIVSDLMETDLHRIINSRQDLSLDHVQYFLYQVLRALKYMHSSNVLHRDLKPSNVLLNSNCDLKVCDLGLARDIESGCQELTEYVVTRWYRAPEIMLACQEYSKAIDVWSVGCIFAELILRRPFFPGDNYIDQLTIICDKLGRPTRDELDFVTTEKARRFVMNLPDTPKQSLRDQFPAKASDQAIDLLSRMLEFHPEKRISVDGALSHPFMKNLHAGNDEPVANFEFCFGFEEEELSRHRLQELMWEEMRQFHPEQGPWKGTLSSPSSSSSSMAAAAAAVARPIGGGWGGGQRSDSPASQTPTNIRKFSHLGAELRSSPGTTVFVPLSTPDDHLPQAQALEADNAGSASGNSESARISSRDIDGTVYCNSSSSSNNNNNTNSSSENKINTIRGGELTAPMVIGLAATGATTAAITGLETTAIEKYSAAPTHDDGGVGGTGGGGGGGGKRQRILPLSGNDNIERGLLQTYPTASTKGNDPSSHDYLQPTRKNLIPTKYPVATLNGGGRGGGDGGRGGGFGQVAPVDGTSGFLLQAGFGHDASPSTTPNMFGKRKMVAGRDQEDKRGR